MPKISVIMPIYNERPKYLKNAIESILNQTYKDFEFIIIDDASESFVQEIINHYNDSRILYKRLDKNSKICFALNTGIELSQSEYIAIMHSDDISIRSRLEKQIKVLENNKNVGLVNSYSVIRYNNISTINMPFLENEYEKLYLKFIGNNIVHPNVMIRKSVLDKHNLRYNPEFVYAEDYRLWTDMIPYCDFYTIPELLTIYNLNVNPNRQNKMYMDTCKKRILLQNYINELSLPDSVFGDIQSKLITTSKIRYIDFLNLQKYVYNTLIENIKQNVDKKFYYSFKYQLKTVLSEFKN